MDNVLNWAKQIESDKRKKPNIQLQKQLFNSIFVTLKDENPSFSDCVNALMKFSKKVIDPFYREYYTRLSDEEQQKWDEALHIWADSTRPTEKATSRIVSIIRIKLETLKDISEIKHELLWLSIHDDKLAVNEFKSLRDDSKVANLRKLLVLDMTSWKFGQAQVEKMFSILFAESVDEATKISYEEFLTRHGKQASIVVDTALPEEQFEVVAPVNPLKSSEHIEPENGPASADDGKEKVKPVTKPTKGHVKNVVFKPQIVSDAKKEELGIPYNGISLAEALLKWTQEQFDRSISQATKIADLQTAAQKSYVHINELAEQAVLLETTLSETRHELLSRDAQLAAANERIRLLEIEKGEAHNTICLVQQMFGNSAKQELDGFKHSLADALSKSAKDITFDTADLTDADKAEVYKALFDELMDTLKHNGIIVEVN